VIHRIARMKRTRQTAVCLLALAALAACGSTGGALVTLPFQAGGAAQADGGSMTFSTSTGWTVTLDQAVIALGPFYFNAFPPNTQTFRSGTVIIEATEQVIVNALDPALYDVPGGADGETGTSVAVEIDLFPPDATQSEANQQLLGGNIGVVAGTAVKGSVVVPFRGSIIINESLVTATNSLAALQRVNGAAVQLDFTAAQQQLTLRVDPTEWFESTDFSSLAAHASGTSESDAGVYTWDETSTFLNQLDQGVKVQAGVYEFSLSPR